MNKAELAGVIRAIAPAIVAYFAGKGVDVSGLLTPEAVNGIAGLCLLLCSLWSVQAKRAASTEAK